MVGLLGKNDMNEPIYVRAWTTDQDYQDLTFHEFIKILPARYKELTIFHRSNGPALEFSNGSKMWYYRGMVHRLDGPATTDTRNNIDLSGLWCVNDTNITEQVNAEIKSGNLNEWPNWTKRDYLYFKLKFS
jgi:hypothetical protein